MASLAGQKPASVASFLVDQFADNMSAIAAITALAVEPDKAKFTAGLLDIATKHSLETRFPTPTAFLETPIAQSPEQSSATMLAAVSMRA